MRSSTVAFLEHMDSLWQLNPVLMESCLAGYSAIMESADVSELVDKIENECYLDSLKDMHVFMDKFGTSKEAYQAKLEQLAVELYQKYRNSEKEVEAEFKTIPDDKMHDFIDMITDVDSRMKVEQVPDSEIVSEVEANHNNIDKLPIHLAVQHIVRNVKLNLLYHRIKDTFLPKLAAF